MNGRVYDYNLGRFLSVDPVIQAPTNSQSINPYSYIMNNPMAGVDPTGYSSTKEEIEEINHGEIAEQANEEKAEVTNGQENENKRESNYDYRLARKAQSNGGSSGGAGISFTQKLKNLDKKITNAIKDVLPSAIDLVDPVTPIVEIKEEISKQVAAGTLDEKALLAALGAVALKKLRAAENIGDVVAGKLKKLDDKYLKKEGIDAHAAKEELNMSNKKNARFDLMVDKKSGKIYQKTKDGTLIESDYTLNELKQYAPLNKR